MPFDVKRDGFVMGEGAAVFVFEEWEHALARGATIWGEVLGAGSNADAHHITAPAPNGTGAAACMRLALAEAGLQPSDIAQINAHGTSTPFNDKLETLAIRRVFGEHAYKIPVSSTKSMTGHLLGSAGGVEAGILALSIRDQLVAPTINYQTPDPDCDLDYVPNEARPVAIRYGLSNSFGFGGTNAALLMKRFED